MAEAIKKAGAKVGMTDVPGFNWRVVHNPDYNKFDYQRATGIDDLHVKKLHTCTVDKEKLSILPYPGKKDPLLGLQFDQREDKSIVLTGMKLLSPFQQTRIEVGWTIFAINGVTDFESAEMAEEVIKEATKVSIICGWVVDGTLLEFTGKQEFIHEKK